MNRYRVSFTLEGDRDRVCIVEAYNRFRALATAMITTSTKSFKDIHITTLKA